MKQWVSKLLEQFAIDWGTSDHHKKGAVDLTEERATLLYILDVYNKHLFETDKHPVRKTREVLDDFAKQLLDPKSDTEKILFKLRQFFSSYRIDEHSYVQNTFDDFKRIIWDFADQLGEDIKVEKQSDVEVEKSLGQLREAVESNSIDSLKAKSREFIDFYIKHQAEKDERRTKRITTIRKNLNSVKKKLVEANNTMRVDHLTQAYNRKSFDEQLENHVRLYNLSKAPVSLMVLDIDHFKKINDCYGHDIGDFVLKECVSLIKQVFNRDSDFVARIGGEEFAVILPDYDVMTSVRKAEECLSRIRREAFVTGKFEIRFTMSMGIAQLTDGEASVNWLKRADEALYQAKNTGRDRYIVSNTKTAA